MKRLIFLSLMIYMIVFSVAAFSYEIQQSNTIPLTDKITGISVNPTTGIAVAVSKETKNLYVIDINTGRTGKKILLDREPSGIVIDIRSNRAIISSKDGTLQYIDIETGSLVKTISALSHSGVDPESGFIDSIAINNEGNTLFISSGKRLILMNLETEQIIKEATLSEIPIGMDIDKDLGYLLITMEGEKGLFLYNADTLEPVTLINIGNILSGVAVNPSTHIAVLTNKTDNSISIISLDEKALIDTIPFESNPGAIAVDPGSNTALISHKDGIAVVKLENPVPWIDTLIPESSKAGEPGLTLSIKGSRFIKDSVTRFNLKELNTLFEDNSNLKAVVPSEELFAPGYVPISIINPLPGGGISNSLIFRIINPVPQVESITPDTVATTSPAINLQIRGKHFLPNSTIDLNGKNLKTKFISSILLEAMTDLTDIQAPAKYPVTVINPMPISLTSNVVFLTVVEDEALLPALKGKEGLKSESKKTTGTLTGRILDTQKQPIEGVTIKVKNVETETDANGCFTLKDVPSGRQHLMIHGETAKKRDKHHPTIPLTVYLEPDRINEMPFQIYLHNQKNRNFKDINLSEDTVLTDPEVPGVEMRIPKGVKITGWDGRPNLKVSVRTVPADRLPVKPLPQNAYVKSVYMFYFDKVGGGVPDQPIPFKSPNDLGLLPGEKAVLWYYDESPNEGEAPNDWAVAGTGTVTPDGMHIVSDPGVGIPKFCCGATAWGGTGSSCPPGGGDDGCHGGCCGVGGGGPPGGGSGGGVPGSGGDGPAISGTAGDPVDLATGYFIHAKTDLYVPGIIPVSISRYYRSGTNNLGTFGRNTYFEYDWWMGAYGADGKINNTNPTMFLLVKPGNYQYRLAKQPDGTFINTSAL